jgi:EAL domain-containing protein (putative c-di-GMP-specific phosphodiesterase class I)
MNPLAPGQSCSACRDGFDEPFPFSMAFQPIVDTETETVYAYEALCRGPNGESAHSVLSQVTEQNRYAFDQSCRVKAISLAAQVGLPATGAKLSINFMPGAVYSPAACIRKTLETAHACNFPLDKLIFEITEQDKVTDVAHLQNIITEYRKHGFKIAIDDFGSGYSGLTFLADFTPDIIKLDRGMTRELHLRPAAAEIVRHIFSLANNLGCTVISEGIETLDEYAAIRDCGASLLQGYLFARPAFQNLPAVNFPTPLDTPIFIPEIQKIM